MANWITHTIIADLLFERYSDLDERSFCVGNIAPDCNIPNADWTSFVPSREVTHFMDGKDKLSARYDIFLIHISRIGRLQVKKNILFCSDITHI
ncbi:MAG: hypothetical protein IJ489_10475 [Clostridia bacterium]|nr:hypothetical protein [Clostridia bacterium]